MGELDNKGAWFLKPIGVVLVILGAIFLPLSVNDYLQGITATVQILGSTMGLASGIAVLAGASSLSKIEATPNGTDS